MSKSEFGAESLEKFNTEELERDWMSWKSSSL